MYRVAVYDSGVGGLSIYQELEAASAEYSSVFVSDNQAYPYGTKPEAELLVRVLNVSKAICQQYQPDILVLACNTASTVCLPKLRERLAIPVVGVVPAIKPAALATHTKTIGLLATPATINRAYTDQLIEDFAPDCTVIRVGSKDLVDMAEAKLSGDGIDLDALKTIFSPFIVEPALDVLVLACTHFPLLKQEIQQVFFQAGKLVKLIDSGMAIANRVSALLNEKGGSAKGYVNADTEPTLAINKAKNIAVFTEQQSCQALQQNLFDMGFDRIEILEVRP